MIEFNRLVSHKLTFIIFKSKKLTLLFVAVKR